MKKNIFKDQNGAISFFVMMSMLFFLFIILGIYTITSKRVQTQTEALKISKDNYYSENETELYNSKIAGEDEIIPIYTKEQLWSIGENVSIEIDGKIYDFSSTYLASYKLQNDIIIDMENDLEYSKFKDLYVSGDNTINTNNHNLYYYYNGNYYIALNYSGTEIVSGTPVLSASGTNLSLISTTIDGLTGTYYIFGYAGNNINTTYVDTENVTNSVTNSAT